MLCGGLSARIMKSMFEPIQCRFRCLEFVQKLFLANFLQQLPEQRPRLESELNKVVALEERRADRRKLFECLRLLHEVFVNIQLVMRAKAIKAMQLKFQFERG